MIDRHSLAVRCLTAYVLLLAQIVLSVEALSLFRAATTRNFVIVEGGCLVLLVAWLTTVRPLHPSFPRFPRPIATWTDFPLNLLVVAVGLALVYELALALFTPPNNWDSMTYHLSRAAAWYHRHGVG